jgi:transposase
MKAYSQDLRDRVINCYVSGVRSITKLSDSFDVGYQAVKSWITRYEQTGDYNSRQGLSGGRQLRFTDKKAVTNFLSTNPDANAIEIRNAIAPDIHMNTFYDALNRMGVTYKKRAKIQRKK